MGVATAIAIGGLAVSAYGAYDASKQGKAAMNAQERAHQGQMGLAGQHMDFSREHYDWARGMHGEYRDQFAPTLEAMQADALEQRDPDYAMISADARSAFGGARMAEQRQMERYGIRPGDGQWGANQRGYGIGQASAEVGAREQARRQTGNDRFARLSSIYGIGAQLQGQAMGQMGVGLSGHGSAAGMGAGALGQQAGAYGQRAQQYGQLAGANAGNFMRGLNHFIDGAMDQPGGTPDYGPAPAGTSGTAPWRSGSGRQWWQTGGGG